MAIQSKGGRIVSIGNLLILLCAANLATASPSAINLSGLASTVATSELNNQWQPELEKHGISISSQMYSKGIKTLKATAVTRSSLRKLVRFLQDETINTDWVPYSGGARILDRTSPFSTIVHFKINAQWPFKPRDAVAAFTLHQDETTREVSILIESLPDFIPLEKDFVRLETYHGYWVLRPIGKEVYIEYVNTVDPGGFIPAWLSNQLAITTTFEAMHNLLTQLPDYTKQQPALEFIHEFSAPVPPLEAPPEKSSKGNSSK